MKHQDLERHLRTALDSHGVLLRSTVITRDDSSGCAVALLGALLADLKSLAHRGPRQACVAGVLYNPSAGCL